MYEHIVRVRVILQAQIDSPIDTLLQDAKVTTLGKLRQYIKKPGLANEKWRDAEDGDKLKEVEGDMKEDL